MLRFLLMLNCGAREVKLAGRISINMHSAHEAQNRKDNEVYLWNYKTILDVIDSLPKFIKVQQETAAFFIGVYATRGV